MKNWLALLFGAAALAFAGMAFAAEVKNKTPDENSALKEVVYLVLMSQSPPLHLIEMPTMEKCKAAASDAVNAKCISTTALGIDALRNKVGGVGYLHRLPARVPPRE